MSEGRSKHHWTIETDDLLATNWSKHTIAGLEELLGFERTTILRHAKRLRGIGISLPEKSPTRLVDQTETHTPKAQKRAVPQPIVSGSQWPDNWRIEAPSLARRMAGR